MIQFKVINQLRLNDGVLMCKKPSGRSLQKAHFKQGDLDGACGAYSVAMVLNILGAFEAEDICSDNPIDKRTSEWKLINALNEEGILGAQAVAFSIYDARELRENLNGEPMTEEYLLKYGLDHGIGLYEEFPQNFKIDLEQYRNKFDETCQGTMPLQSLVSMVTKQVRHFSAIL